MITKKSKATNFTMENAHFLNKKHINIGRASFTKQTRTDKKYGD